MVDLFNNERLAYLLATLLVFTYIFFITLLSFKKKISRPIKIILIIKSIFIFLLASYFWFRRSANINSILLSISCLFLFQTILKSFSLRTTYQKKVQLVIKSFVVIGLVMAFITILELNLVKQVNWHLFKNILLGACLSMSIISLFNTIFVIAKSRIYDNKVNNAAILPTISVLISARNEEKNLIPCLDSVLSSNYEKMEIIVLDDCSSDLTPELTKAYASKGIRFIPGTEPPLGWLGQNWAYHNLYIQSTGKILIYCGVDTKLSPYTITRIVKYLTMHKFIMISIQPLFLHLDVLPQFFQPLKILWQTTFKNFLKRPPVSSGLFAIRRNLLEKIDGFNTIPSELNPENYLATELTKYNKYFYAMATADDGVTSRKKLSSLWQTAIRNYYPLHGKNPGYVFIALLFICFTFYIPLTGLINSIKYSNIYIPELISIISLLLWWCSHLIITTRVNPSSWFLALINLPVMVLSECILLVVSMLKFDLGEVKWKDRNIVWVEKEQEVRDKAILKFKGRF